MSVSTKQPLSILIKMTLKSFENVYYFNQKLRFWYESRFQASVQAYPRPSDPFHFRVQTLNYLAQNSSLPSPYGCPLSQRLCPEYSVQLKRTLWLKLFVLPSAWLILILKNELDCWKKTKNAISKKQFRLCLNIHTGQIKFANGNY